MAAVIALLSLQVPKINASLSPQSLMKQRDLLQGGERDVIRYFYKRAKCSCLKDKWKLVKAKPKLGWCYHCNERKERKDLMVCSACRIHQYCSKSCQREAWPRHQEKCIVANTIPGLMTRTL